ncbi:MAG: response regulator transcription factor [Candidatus Promineifilaceae bacterium]|jgi:two-component system phosphate regulon response regulator PhoB
MKRILVAEDDRDIGELIRLILEHGGSQVTSAKDGQEALTLAQQSQYDAFVLDVKMPRLSGLDVCRRLRSSHETKDTPIIFISARGQESEIHAGLNAGANAYVVKPFDPEDLWSMVDGVMSSGEYGIVKH